VRNVLYTRCLNGHNIVLDGLINSDTWSLFLIAILKLNIFLDCKNVLTLQNNVEQHIIYITITVLNIDRLKFKHTTKKKETSFAIYYTVHTTNIFIHIHKTIYTIRVNEGNKL